MKHIRKLAVLTAAFALAGCSTLGDEGFGSNYFALVPVRDVRVGDGSMAVTPPRPWNRARAQLFEDIHDVEDWTLNGPLLDSISYVTSLRSGRYLIRQDRREAQQVPKFRSDMTPPEIAAMVESLYRVKGGSVEFRTTSLQPRPFLGAPNGFQWDFEHLDSDEVWRRGRAVGAVINGQLYLILFDATRSHYYAAALPDFESIAASARRRR